MVDRWSREQVLALAPDASARAGAERAAVPGPWSGTGSHLSGGDAAVWGECKGSGAKPYRTCVELSAPAYRCTCPSRKFPCKHVLGLLLLWAEGAVAAAEAVPDWVAEWLEGRREREARSAARRERASAEEAPSDPEAARQRAPKGTGERAWWLEQLVARAPLGTWIGWLGETPAEIVGLTRDEWGAVVQAGWVRAAIAQRDAGWASALLERGASVELLLGLPGPWAGELAEAVLDKISRASGDSPHLATLCHGAAERLAPELYPRVQSLRGEPHRAVAKLAATLRFRHDMLKELQ